MAFDVLPVPVPGSATFNIDAQLFASGLAGFAEEANALGSVIDLSLKSTSTTSLAIATGSKTLTVQTGLGYVIGHPVRIASVASPSNYMDGIVTAYNTGTGSLTVNVTSVGGSGTIASWNTMVLPGGGSFAATSNNKFTGRQIFADEVTVASASTLDLTSANSNQFVITGTTTITAVTMEQGAVYKLRFTGVCQITHGSSLQLPGAANYTTAAGDIVTLTSNGTVVRAEIVKVDGTAVVAPVVVTATSNPTGTSNDGSPVSSSWVKLATVRSSTLRQANSQATATSVSATTSSFTAGTAGRFMIIALGSSVGTTPSSFSVTASLGSLTSGSALISANQLGSFLGYIDMSAGQATTITATYGSSDSLSKFVQVMCIFIPG